MEPWMTKIMALNNYTFGMLIIINVHIRWRFVRFEISLLIHTYIYIDIDR